MRGHCENPPYLRQKCKNQLKGMSFLHVYISPIFKEQVLTKASSNGVPLKKRTCKAMPGTSQRICNSQIHVFTLDLHD